MCGDSSGELKSASAVSSGELISECAASSGELTLGCGVSSGELISECAASSGELISECAASSGELILGYAVSSGELITVYFQMEDGMPAVMHNGISITAPDFWRSPIPEREVDNTLPKDPRASGQACRRQN